MENFIMPQYLKNQLPDITIKYIVFVFTHLTSSYSYDKETEDKVYYMDDPRLDDPDKLPDQKTYTALFFKYFGEALEKGKPVIELPYNPYMAFMLSHLKAELESHKAANILAVSFFHSDSEVQARGDKYGKIALEMKFQIINSMIAYPFIKKVEIPIDEVVTGDFLKDLMKE
jgi:hypothetical protein